MSSVRQSQRPGSKQKQAGLLSRTLQKDICPVNPPRFLFCSSKSMIIYRGSRPASLLSWLSIPSSLTQTHTDTQTHIDTHRHTHRLTHTQTHTHTHRHIHTQTHTHRHTHRLTHTQTHTQTHRYTHRHTHTDTLTQTHSHIYPLSINQSSDRKKEDTSPGSIFHWSLKHDSHVGVS